MCYMNNMGKFFIVVLSLLLSIAAVCSCVRDDYSVQVQEVIAEPMELHLGESAEVKYSVMPLDAVYEKMYFASMDRNIVRVDQEGLVTGLSIGSTAVTVTVNGKTGISKVKVIPAVAETVRIDTTDFSLEEGQAVMLEAEVYPEYTAEKTVVWSSSDEGIVSVDNNGLVTALSEGQAVVRASVGDVYDEVNITVTKVVPKIGDFFYSDGTFSTELNGNKDVIGLVFWTGNPGKDDEALRREHPECVNGLVVSVEDAGSMVAWQSNYVEYGLTVGGWIDENTDYSSITTSEGLDQPLNRIIGYNNTKGIGFFNADASNSGWMLDVGTSLSSWQVVAPDNTSGWYIPSAKELTLLCSGEYSDDIMYMPSGMMDVKNRLNEVLTAIGKQVLGGYYWSSTELDAQLAIIHAFDVGVVWSEYKDEFWSCSMRPVLAF